MSHEHSDNHQRLGQDQHVPVKPSEVSSRPSPPTQQNPKHTGLSQGEYSYPAPNQQSLPALENLPTTNEMIAWAYHGPTPLPEIIKQHNDIQPGSGDRIMDDAHEDMVLDRNITKSSFEYALFEAKVRLLTAVGIIITVLTLIPLFLFFLDPPESIIGSIVVGSIAAAPLVGTLLNSKNSNSNPKLGEKDDEKQ